MHTACKHWVLKAAAAACASACVPRSAVCLRVSLTRCSQQMCTPFQFPPRTLQQLKDSCPSKAQGRNWKSEVAYRDECIDVIQKTCEGLQM